jgi:hypothetical protein
MPAGSYDHLVAVMAAGAGAGAGAQAGAHCRRCLHCLPLSIYQSHAGSWLRSGQESPRRNLEEDSGRHQQ